MRAATRYWLLATRSRLGPVQARLLEGAGGRLRGVLGEDSVDCAHGRDVRSYKNPLFESNIAPKSLEIIPITSSLKSRAVPPFALRLLFAFSPLPSALSAVSP